MTSSDTPRVSVIMANFDGAAHICEAVQSVLGQTETSLELLLSDDGSSDDSLARAQGAAAGDARLILLESPVRGGPGAARNRALSRARGNWIAVVDNDDFIAPERLQRLINAAEADGADIAADNLITFYQDQSRPAHRHLGAAAPLWVSAAFYANSNLMLRGGAQLGFLKPVFRRHVIETRRYDESLPIGEDADLVQRLLIAGAKMRLYPEMAFYHYRKHQRSVSHRLPKAAADALLAGLAKMRSDDPTLARALNRQRNALLDAKAFLQIVEALKAKDAAAAARAAWVRPRALLLLGEPLRARLERPI